MLGGYVRVGVGAIRKGWDFDAGLSLPGFNHLQAFTDHRWHMPALQHRPEASALSVLFKTVAIGQEALHVASQLFERLPSLRRVHPSRRWSMSYQVCMARNITFRAVVLEPKRSAAFVQQAVVYWYDLSVILIVDLVVGPHLARIRLAIEAHSTHPDMTNEQEHSVS